MNLPPTTVPGRRPHLRADLRAMFADGVSFSVMVGMGETYFAAFLIALGAGDVWAGLISTIPMLAGGVLQLFTPRGVAHFGSRRRWVVVCSSAQALAFLPLAIGAMTGRIPVWGVFIAATLYWTGGMGAGPVWNAWAGQLVPRRLRTRYFGRRTWGSQIGVLVGLLGAGLILQTAVGRGIELLGFALVFLIAGVARVISVRYIASQSEPALPDPDERLLRGKALSVRLLHSTDGRLLVFLVTMGASVTISSPYFNPYMLRVLNLDYASYMTLIGVSFGAKILALGLLGGVAQRVGALWLVRGGSAGIVFIPLLWLVSQNFGYLVGLQMATGVFWAAYEFGAFLLLLETIPERDRTGLLTLFNFGNAVAMVGGSMLGGALLAWMGQQPRDYEILFALSTGARLLAFLLLLRVSIHGEPTLSLMLRTIAVRPSAGGLMRPIAATVRRRRKPSALEDR